MITVWGSSYEQRMASFEAHCHRPVTSRICLAARFFDVDQSFPAAGSGEKVRITRSDYQGDMPERPWFGSYLRIWGFTNWCG